MVDYAIKHGANYFDTAYGYHGGESERVIGQILKNYPRDSYYLASKFPGYEVRAEWNAKEQFEEQLKKCGVDYFDFYMLHNVYERNIETYFDERWNIVEYLIEQKKNGRIKHLGFSTHGLLPTIERFLGWYEEYMELAMSALPEAKRPGACIKYGKCKQVCPQNIDIPTALHDFQKMLDETPSWG